MKVEAERIKVKAANEAKGIIEYDLVSDDFFHFEAGNIVMEVLELNFEFPSF